MDLSKRLQAVAGLVPPGKTLADVGTDHGYIPISLVKEKKIPSGIAMDVNKGPLERAKVHIHEEGLETQIKTRLSDGLKELLPGEVSTVVIAGMGGALTIRILEEGRKVTGRLDTLILQPQSEIARVRRWLADNGFAIDREDMVKEDGKYYPMMRAVHGRMVLEREIQALYGPLLLKEKHPCLADYLQWEWEIKKGVQEQLSRAEGTAAEIRKEQVAQDIARNREAWEEIRGTYRQ